MRARRARGRWRFELTILLMGLGTGSGHDCVTTVGITLSEPEILFSRGLACSLAVFCALAACLCFARSCICVKSSSSCAAVGRSSGSRAQDILTSSRISSSIQFAGIHGRPACSGLLPLMTKSSTRKKFSISGYSSCPVSTCHRTC